MNYIFPIKLSLLVVGLIFWLSPYNLLWAQTSPASTTCATLELTPAQALSLVQQANSALQQKRSARRAFTDVTYVPIRPHIIRQSDGTGGYSLVDLNEAMATTNRYFLINGFGIQFYFAGESPDYIDDDGQYQGFTNVSGRDAYNALNQYYINAFPPDQQISGYANYPADNIESTRSVIRTYGNSSTSQAFKFGDFLIPHELGHTFGLIHTFGPSNGAPTTELVTRGAGANCQTAGDLICDTPADPYGIPGANSGSDGHNCFVYAPTMPVHDANGDSYNPSLFNLMSYWPSCRYEFTPGQYDRMQAGLALRQSHTSYSLTAPATNVNPPTNLYISYNGSSVVLTWQDNATNEMGYFIERSTSPTTGFVPVGGVAPDVTTFSDTKFTVGPRYYYRIRPSNTILGNLSVTTSIETNPCVVPQYPNSSPARISASLNWVGDVGQTYVLRWRVAGTGNWTSVNNIPNGQFSTQYSLTGLTSSTAYEWQVQGVCSTTSVSEFTDTQSFTTLACQNPTNYNTSNVGAETVQFFWYNAYDEAGRTAEIRYRIIGNPNWATVSNISSVSFSTTYTLTGLTTNTTYEWQLRTLCSGTESLDYGSVATFTTLCRTPTALSSIPTTTRALLAWSLSSVYDVGTTYEIHYRPVGSTIWTVISSIVGGGNSGNTYSLTGLTVNTQYEWQVRTACSANAYSNYSGSNQFTTACKSPTTNGLGTSLKSSASIQLNWSIANDIGTPYDIRYRPVGSSNWLTVSATNTTIYGGSYNLTGLSNNTTYEWQIRTVCSPTQQSDFIAGPTFTTQCLTPSILFVTQGVTAAILSWFQTGVDVTYDVQYRRVGTTNWTTVSSVASASVAIAGLTGNTGYEWQVRTRCADGIVTDFSAINTFSTYSCGLPTTLQTTTISANSARLNWYFSYINTDTRFDIRYRIVGATDWTQLANLSIASGTGYFDLSGLSSATAYEWQIRAVCSATEHSEFTSSTIFQTLVPCPVMYTLKSGLWNDPAVWSCNRLPNSTDAVQLKHLITIPASYQAQALQIKYDPLQRLIMGSSASMRFGL